MPNTYNCSYEGCDVSFNREWKLKRHICTHTNERPFKCNREGCSKSYRCNSHLQRHITVSHAENINLAFFKCTQCTKLFSNKYSLKKHMKIHNNDTQYKCDVCQASFKKHNELTIHSATHTGQSAYVCENCDANFNNKADLTKHQRRYKKYSCEHDGCPVVSETWSVYRKHLKDAHSGYTCDNCQKQFKNKTFLQEHVLSHISKDDRNVFVCSEANCTKFYYHKRNLTQHMNVYHNGKRFICDFGDCTKTFAHKVTLNHHKKTHDPNRPLPPKKVKTERKPRKDKGKLRSSIAAKLGGFILPPNVEMQLVNEEKTPELENLIRSAIEETEGELEQPVQPVYQPLGPEPVPNIGSRGYLLVALNIPREKAW